MRYLCVHCHFYQPPRENPWLEQIELQDSAFPYHDWNARIHSECYARNAAARILDEQDRIRYIVNNYGRISFNFGPTLLSWMKDKAPETYSAILDADAESRERFGGHGSAMAQVYNHIIMPLANSRDKRTQVLWGIQDFRSRFGRMPEGMWLAETAVDMETLSLMAAEGIKFTVLAPSQARAERAVGAKEWIDASGGRIDPTKVYRVNTPSGPIAVFFYVGSVSQAVAFERLLDNGVKFAERLMGAFPATADWNPLVHIATDGETYGHHHKFGEMALAYALHHIEENQLARITNYGQYLELNPPAREAEIIENTAWSCAHGVGRWSRDCGCNTGAGQGWNQKWRQPLREAMNWLRDELTPAYEKKAAEFLKDPWAARDEYISVILDRSDASRERFSLHHMTEPLEAGEAPGAWKLLEMQRHLMLMYTSCGWFFDEISGIETVQVIEYAARAVQLAQELFGDSIEERFIQKLQSARSNVAEQGDGAAIYRKTVRPAMASLDKVGAHFAVSSMFEATSDEAVIYCYRVQRESNRLMQAGQIRLGIGQARISSQITMESERFCYAVLHFGGQNIHARVGKLMQAKSFQRIGESLSSAFERSDLAAVIRIMDRGFASEISLRSLFKDAQRRIATQILADALDDTERAHRALYARHVPLLRMLHDVNIPVPDSLRSAAEFALNGMLRDAFGADPMDIDRCRALLEEAQKTGIRLNATNLELGLRASIDRLGGKFFENPRDGAALTGLLAVVEMARSLPFPVTLWSLQNRCYSLHRAMPSRPPQWAGTFRALMTALRMNPA